MLLDTFPAHLFVKNILSFWDVNIGFFIYINIDQKHCIKRQVHFMKIGY